MPYASKRQWRLFFAKEARGELAPGTAQQWADETPGGYDSLPEASSGAPWVQVLGDAPCPGVSAGLRLGRRHAARSQLRRELVRRRRKPTFRSTTGAAPVSTDHTHTVTLPDFICRPVQRTVQTDTTASAGAQPMTTTHHQGTVSPTIKYKIVCRPDGMWCGVASVPTKMGPVTVTACAHPTAEAKEIIRRLLARLPPGAASGFLGKVFKGAKNFVKSVGKVAKKVAQGKILSALKESAKVVTRNPLIRRAVGWAATPFLGPAAKFVPMGLKAAGNIMFRARARRDPRARQVVQRVTAMARRGNPRARRMAQYMWGANRVLNRYGYSYFARQPPVPRGWGRPRFAGAAGAHDQSANGEWVGQVFVPHAYSGSAAAEWLKQFRFRTGYPQVPTITLREAYRSGLQASPR